MEEKKEVASLKKEEVVSWSEFALLEHCARNLKVDQNVVLGPASVYAAMAMAGFGAGGKTESEFKQVFGKHFKRQAQMHASVFARILGQVSIANGIFARATVLPMFKELLIKVFNAQIWQDLSKEFINNWCAANTNGMIKELLVQEIDPLTQAVILSVVFLKAKWARRFDKSLTYKAKFNKLHDVWLMKQTFKEALYLKNRMFQAIVLPYENRKLEMVVFLPSERTSTEEVIKRLVISGVPRSWYFQRKEVSLSLPRMKLAYDLSLKKVLIEMGLILPFDRDRAEFPKICKEPVFISDVIHKAVMEVDEEGTIASAGTAASMRLRCIPVPPIPMVVDRPFLVLLRTTESNIPIFIALVNKPM